jgi:hypothetical protein
LDALDELAQDTRITAAGRAAIWEVLRAKAAQHREFENAKWALPADAVTEIETTAQRFEPTDPTERYGWLFKQDMPTLSNTKRFNNFAAYDAALMEARATAVTEIADAASWPGLRSFAVSTEYSWIVGKALAQAGRFEYESELLSLLAAPDRLEVNFASGYFSERFRAAGWNWLERHLRSGVLSPIQSAKLLLDSNDYPKSWETAEKLGDLVAAIYWKEFVPYGLGPDFPHVDFVAERLLSANRPDSALALITIYSRERDGLSLARAELIARGLEDLLSRQSEATPSRFPSHFELRELLDALEGSELPRDRVARLEWAYLPALGYDARPAALSTMLSQDPNFFVDIIRRIYRPRDRDEAQEEAASNAEEDTVDEAQKRAIATNAYRLLMEWKDVPGQREDGSVDAEALENWVNDVRAKLRESGHLEAGDIRIGHVLAWGPADPDGARPCLAVRNLIEKLESDDLEQGLGTELRNSRGVTSRGVYDGGEQERALAETYLAEAKQFTDRWPRTAAMLRRLGECYGQEARWIDGGTERRRVGFDR